MRSLARTAGLAIAALIAAPALVAAPALAAPKLTAEQKLAKQLEGRVAGEPVNCIYMPTARNSRVYDKTAIVYEAGDVLYVNRPSIGAERLDDDDILVVQMTGSQLCRVDTIQLVDRNSGFWTGFVGLDRFVPYRRADKATATN